MHIGYTKILVLWEMKNTSLQVENIIFTVTEQQLNMMSYVHTVNTSVSAALSVPKIPAGYSFVEYVLSGTRQ